MLTLSESVHKVDIVVSRILRVLPMIPSHRNAAVRRIKSLIPWQPLAVWRSPSYPSRDSRANRPVVPARTRLRYDWAIETRSGLQTHPDPSRKSARPRSYRPPRRTHWNHSPVLLAHPRSVWSRSRRILSCVHFIMVPHQERERDDISEGDPCQPLPTLIPEYP